MNEKIDSELVSNDEVIIKDLIKSIISIKRQIYKEKETDKNRSLQFKINPACVFSSLVQQRTNETQVHSNQAGKYLPMHCQNCKIRRLLQQRHIQLIARTTVPGSLSLL